MPAIDLTDDALNQKKPENQREIETRALQDLMVSIERFQPRLA
ncbi:hypothetical protein [Vibrio cholerae]|nr:hypothetical protein [Vibrio cholerae]